MTASAAAWNNPAPGEDITRGERLMSIGEVLAQLRGEFPNVTISKLRFLETEGLVEPRRTPAGYRKYTWTDVARLRYVLTAQRDQYLPLRVIREHLATMGDPLTEVGSAEPADAPGGLGLPRAELLEGAELDDGVLRALGEQGLLRAATAAMTPTRWRWPPPRPGWPSSAWSRGTCAPTG